MKHLLQTKLSSPFANWFAVLSRASLLALLLGAAGAWAQEFTFSSETYTIPENIGTTYLVKVNWDGGVDGSLDYRFTDDTAVYGVDYLMEEGTLTFTDGATEAWIPVDILDNPNRDGNRTFTLDLFAPTIGAVGVPGTAVVTIEDDEAAAVLKPAGALQFTAATYLTSESDDGYIFPLSQEQVRITVTRDQAANGRVMVDYTITEGTALYGTDFDYPMGYSDVGTLVFEDFEMSKDFYIPIYDNDATNQEELRFMVSLSNPRLDPAWHETDLAPTLGETTQAIIRILDNDVGFNLDAVAYRSTTGFEGYGFPGGGGVRVYVRLPSNHRHKDGTSVDYRVREIPGADSYLPLTAGSDFGRSGLDFNAFGGTLTFGSNDYVRSFNVPFLSWTTPEFNKDIRVELHSPKGKFLQGTNEVDSRLGIVTNANITMIPGGMVHVSSGTNIANAQPAGAVDLKWNTDGVSWTIPPYNPTPGANNTIYSLVVQPDDKILVAGDFNAINTDPWNHIGRMLPHGVSDPSFTIGTGADSFVDAMALYTNGTHQGKIVIGGGFTSFNGISRYKVARLNANGTVDTGFNPGTGVDGIVRAVAIQPDNKVIIGGEFRVVNGITRQNIARLNADGSVDLSFDPGTGPEAGADATVWTVAVMGNSVSNAIVIGGDFAFVNGALRLGVARFNSDGSLDTSFDPGSGTDSTVYSIAVQPDQKILLGGAFSQINLFSRNGVARLNVDGSLDLTFDPGTGTDNTVYGVKVLPDSKILIAGAFSSYNDTRRVGLARLHSFGVVDTSFMDTALNQFAGIMDRTNFVIAVDVQSSGAVMIGGSFQRVGGGGSRTDWCPRYNIARLVEGSTPGPGYVEFTRTEYRVDEYGGYLYAALMRRDGSLGPITITGQLRDGLAQADVDYETYTDVAYWPYYDGYYLADGWVNSITFNPSIIASVTNDNLMEGNENFLVDFVPPFDTLPLGGDLIPLGVGLGRRNANCLVVDDDFSRGEFTFSAPTYIANENGVYAFLTVIRTNGTSGEASVDYLTSIGPSDPATPYVDYMPTNRTLSFANGQLSQTIRIPVVNDTTVEPDETFTVRLNNPRGGAGLGAITNAVVTLIDDDYKAGRLSFSAVTYSESETTPYVTITVQRRGGNLGQVSATYSTADGTAVDGQDYNAVTGSLVWNDSDSSDKTFTVPLLNDILVEGSKTVTLSLSGFVSALPGGTTNATLTITDDDSFGSLEFSSANYVTDENGGAAIITVVRTGGIAGLVTVEYSSMALPPGPGAAIPGTHYNETEGMIEFQPGQLSTTFQIPIINGTAMEGDHALNLVLANPGGGAGLGARSISLLTIVDDESVNIPAGSIDTTFVAGAGANSYINGMALQTNGFLVLGGDFTTFDNSPRNHLARLNTAGGLDGVFGVGLGTSGSIYSIAIQDDARVVLGGAFTTFNGTNRNNIVRVLTDGSIDTSFNPGAGADNPVNAVALQRIGSAQKVVIGGAFSSVNGIGRSSLARLNENGTVDVTFNPGSGANGPVYALAVQPDGKLLVGGDFTFFDGLSNNCIVRLNTNGTVDTTFAHGLGANGAVRAIAVQTDGQILLGGVFSSFNGVTNASRFARVDVNGQIDSLFLTNIGTAANGAVLAIALQIDGKIVLGGDFTSFNGITRNRLTRLNADGSVDPTINFGSGADNFIDTIVIQPDRKIVIAGGFTSYNGQPRNRIARIHGGSLFGAGSLQFGLPTYTILESASNAVVEVRRMGGTMGSVSVDFTTVAQTATGGQDFVAMSEALVFPEGETRRVILIPILNDGLVENDETVGLVLSNVSGGAQLGGQPTATLTILNDDSQVNFSAPNYTITENFPTGNASISVTRTGALSTSVSVEYRTSPLTARPGLDYTAVSGTLTFWPGETTKFFNVPIIINPEISPNLTLLVLLTNLVGQGQIGQPRSAVLTIVEHAISPGLVTLGTNAIQVKEGATNLVLQVMRTNGHTGSVTVRSTTINGTASNGIDFYGGSTNLVFADGEILKTVTIRIEQDSEVEGNETFDVELSNPTDGLGLGLVSRLTVTIEDDDFGPGSLDTTFDPGSGANAFVRTLALLPDERIVIGGAFTRYGGSNFSYVAQVKTNGAVDTTFNPGSGANALVNSVTVQSNGTIVLGGGFTTFNGAARKRVVKLQANGAVDMNLTQDTALNSVVNAVRGLSDNKILAAGSFLTPQPGISRLQVNGAVDTSFNTGAGITNGVVFAMLVQDGKIVLGGSFSEVDRVPRTRVARMNSNGSLDLGFTPPTITGGTVYTMALQPDGRLVIAGDFSTVNGSSRPRIARLNTDGSLDTNFVASTNLSGTIYAIALQPNGKVVAGGSFTSIDGRTRNRVARFNTNGSLDLSFDPGLGANSTVYALALQRDGRVIIGGDFTSVNGFVRNGLARLNADPLVPTVTISSYEIVGGMFTVGWESQAGRNYEIFASTDLVNWSSITTVPATGGNTTYSDPSSAGLNWRFYRIRLLAP